MSTRCNIKIKDSNHELWFYRHCDGYPSATGESLKTFLRWLHEKRIRDNVGQASGWLILLGAIEYQTMNAGLWPGNPKWDDLDGKDRVREAIADFCPYDWKCGAYEPTVGQHGDIDYLYVIDLQTKTISCHYQGDDKAFWVVTDKNIDIPIEEQRR